MDKFDRKYLLSVMAKSGETIVIEPPFSIEFDFTRNFMGSANVGSIRIYNLNQVTRDKIQKDSYAFTDNRLVNLKAGYGRELADIFTGNISRAWSTKEGQNVVTAIESFDGGQAFKESNSNFSVGAGTPKRAVIMNFLNDLKAYGIATGSVGNYEGKTGRGNSFSGPTTALLSELTGGGFFIDNMRANCLGDNECIDASTLTINSQSGLLGTPIREETNIYIDMIFEPRVKIGQEVILDSLTAKSLNRRYKIVSIKHRGTISESVAGNATTTLGLLASEILRKIAP